MEAKDWYTVNTIRTILSKYNRGDALVKRWEWTGVFKLAVLKAREMLLCDVRKSIFLKKILAMLNK